MKIKIFLLLVILITVFCAGCTSNTSNTSNTPIVDARDTDVPSEVITVESMNTINSLGGTVTVMHYNTKNVTCFVLDIYNGGGISCLPDSEITR